MIGDMRDTSIIEELLVQYSAKHNLELTPEHREILYELMNESNDFCLNGRVGMAVEAVAFRKLAGLDLRLGTRALPEWKQDAIDKLIKEHYELPKEEREPITLTIRNWLKEN